VEFGNHNLHNVLNYRSKWIKFYNIFFLNVFTIAIPEERVTQFRNIKCMPKLPNELKKFSSRCVDGN